MSLVKYFSLAIICLSLTACSTLFNSKNQTVAISSNPSGALVKVINKQGEAVFNGITPTKAFLNKSDGTYLHGHDYQIEISKSGYLTEKMPLEAQMNWIYWLNPISTISIDSSNGTLYNFNPSSINIELTKRDNKNLTQENNTKEVKKLDQISK